jgi:beta-glucanase (GH16 family)
MDCPFSLKQGSTRSRYGGFSVPARYIQWIAVLLTVILPRGATIAHAQENVLPNDVAPATLEGKTYLTIPGEQWKLLWNDEFSGDRLDTSKWTNRLSWAGDDGGHRHHNVMYASLISDDDVVLHDGMISLLTKKEDAVDLRKRTFHYTQAFIQTEGKFSYTYGYCEIRAKVPIEAGRGLWPAFWMLSRGWPPEDDIAEFWTGRPKPHFHQGFAYRLPASGRVQWNSRHIDDVPKGFHTYGMEWGPGYQLMNFDGNITVRIYGAQAPNIPMYLILNSGVTSDPLPLPTTVFPNAFVVDYVRVYARPNVIPLHDPGFENIFLNPWKPWKDAKRVTQNAYSGNAALCLTGSPSSAEQRIFGLAPNTTYSVSGWADAAGDGEVRLGVKYYKGPEVWTAYSGKGYRQIKVNFTAGPHDTMASIYCFKSTGAGSAYFDDIAIAPVNGH